MERLRICEILDKGIDVPFRFDGRHGNMFEINDDGILLACYSSSKTWVVADGMDICEMINSGIPRWTEEDVEAAKAIRWLIPLASKIGWDGGVKAVLGEFEDKVLLDLPPKFFPSLRRDETIKVDDILKGEENAD